MLDSFPDGCIAAPADDLGPASNSYFQAVAVIIFRNLVQELLNEVGPLRP